MQLQPPCRTEVDVCSPGDPEDMEVDDRSTSGSQAGPSVRMNGHSQQNEHRPAGSLHQQSSSLPMLASACPGWVCYAEKTHGDLVLPYMSTTRSPQVLLQPSHSTLLHVLLHAPSASSQAAQRCIMEVYESYGVGLASVNGDEPLSDNATLRELRYRTHHYACSQSGEGP